jgi:hypothetical protein
MWAMLAESPGQAFLAAAFLVAAFAALGVTLAKTEFGKAARRRRHLYQRASQTARERAQRAADAVGAAAPAGAGGLTPADLARLARFRPRARMMRGEPLEQPAWFGKLRLLWRDGYSGWIVASLAGAFSMATHFGLLWLVSGGGWAGAAVVTLASTAVMVTVCVWLLLGLNPSR